MLAYSLGECRSSRQNVGFRSHGLFQIIQGTLRRLRFGRCRANVHWTFCTPALAAASYPFVDLPSGDTLRCKLFPADKFYKISLYFDGRVKYNEVDDKSEVAYCIGKEKLWTEW